MAEEAPRQESVLQRLAACPGCGRRLDASGRTPGDALSCPCGETVIVPAPALEDAEVVRCSACGSPRREREPSCRSCGADFTLHERDLNLVCPGCLHRTSRKGRFCHHCGIPLLKDQAVTSTELACPACETPVQLDGRRLDRIAGMDGDLAVLECPRCAGLWLEPEPFRLLEEMARASVDAAGAARPAGAPPVALDRAAIGAQTRAYRPCVVCGRLMNRRNYAKSSGVLIDVCQEHGAWFDLDELAQILAWIRGGGLERQSARQREMQRDAESRRRLREAAVPAIPSVGERAAPRAEGLLWLVELFTTLLGWRR